MSENLPTVPSAQNLATQLAQRAQTLAGSGGDYPFLKMDKTGEWVYGPDETEVQEGSRWAINPHSFVEGYVCWGDGEVLGEEMAPMTGQPVVLADLPKLDGSKRGWEKQAGFMLVCLNGEDKGEQVIYKTASKGGQKAVRKVIDKLVSQIASNPIDIVPHIIMDSDSYKHPTYGKIFNPIFNIVDWTPVEQAEAPAAEAPAAEAPAALEVQPEAAPEVNPEPAPKKKTPAVTKKRKRRAIASD